MIYNHNLSNINEILAYLFNFDNLEINRINESTIKIKAVISSGKTVKNFYKLFLSYIDEIEKAKDDRKSLIVLKAQLAELKKEFDNYIEDTRITMSNLSDKYKIVVSISYEEDFKIVYDKISELII
ncbi:MAG: hypothetical protein K2K85_05555 [Clostridia bacterium]|nr:hypothetical protein [Clostridia bacterium]